MSPMESIGQACRVIIHIDLDFFYGQVEARLDASLRHLPFAIQQKHIVVTCNYLARARGVRKLQLLTDATRLCPELIVINGEDIQKYRDASKEVFDYICRMLGPCVQKLGLDEVWCDITAHLDELRADMGVHRTPFSKATIGDLQCDVGIQPIGFILGTFDAKRLDHDRLRIGSYVAAALRRGILEQHCFTSSAGISTSKVLAKLVGSERKPDAQTTILPEVHAQYIGNVPIQKIPGVGIVILRRLLAECSDEPSPESRTVEVTASSTYLEHVDEDYGDVVSDVDAEINDKPTSSLKEGFLVANRISITAGFVRKHLKLEQLIAWFGVDRGAWLYDIVRAKDESRVVPSSSLPTIISIEDSFVHCASRLEVTQRLTDLCLDLIRRMEGDLKNRQGEWLLYAKNVRLTPRFRDVEWQGTQWRHKRFSKSAKCPVELFDSQVPPPVRAQLLVRTSLMPLFDNLIRNRPNWVLSLLNIAVTDLHEDAPGPSIKGFLGLKRAPASAPTTNGNIKHKRVCVGSVPANNNEIDKATDYQGRNTPVESVSELEDDAEDVELAECRHCDVCDSMIPIFVFESHVCLTASA